MSRAPKLPTVIVGSSFSPWDKRMSGLVRCDRLSSKALRGDRSNKSRGQCPRARKSGCIRSTMYDTGVGEIAASPPLWSVRHPYSHYASHVVLYLTYTSCFSDNKVIAANPLDASPSPCGSGKEKYRWLPFLLGKAGGSIPILCRFSPGGLRGQELSLHVRC